MALSPRMVKLKWIVPLPTSVKFPKEGPVPPDKNKSHKLTLLPKVTQGKRMLIFVSVCCAEEASSSYKEPLRTLKPTPVVKSFSVDSFPKKTACSATPVPRTVFGPTTVSLSVTAPKLPIFACEPIMLFSM